MCLALIAALTLDISLSQAVLSCEAWRMWMGRAQGYYGRHMETIPCGVDPSCPNRVCTQEPKPGEAVLIKVMTVDENGNKNDVGLIEWVD